MKPKPHELHPPSSKWHFPLVTLPIFAVYLETLNPSLFRNDSPETITACFTLGVAHPPGYPLYTLLGRLFGLLRIGNPAYTLNLFSALLGSIGVFFLFKCAFLILRTTQKQDPMVAFWASLGSTYVFGLSKSYWSASLSAKGGIYSSQAALELFFLYFLLLFFSKSRRSRKSFPPSSKIAPFFLLGLGLSNQWPTLLLFLTALTATSAITLKPNGRATPTAFLKRTVFSSSFLVMACSLYLYVPLRANQNPALNFWSPSNSERFFASLFRTRYFRTETMVSATNDFFHILSQKSIYLSDRFSWEFPILFSLLALWGICELWRHALRSHLLFLVTLTCVTLAANLLYLKVSPIDFWHLDDHLLTLNWVTGLLGAIGFGSLLAFVGPRPTRAWVVLVFFALFPALALYQNLPFTDQTREILYRGIGMQALRSMDKNPVYFAESDFDYFSLLYLREVEGKRQDLELHLTTFLDEPNWRDLVSGKGFKIQKIPRPCYCAFANGDLINGLLKRKDRVSFYPTGTVIRFSLHDSPPAGSPSRVSLDDLWTHYLEPALSGNGTFIHNKGLNPINGLMVQLAAHPYLNLSKYLLLKGDKTHWDEDQGRALSMVQDPGWRGAIWTDKARADLKLGRRSEAVLELDRAAADFNNANEPVSVKATTDLADIIRLGR